MATLTRADLIGGQADTGSVRVEAEIHVAFRAPNAACSGRYPVRHCPRADLPESWRSNAIGDLE